MRAATIEHSGSLRRSPASLSRHGQNRSRQRAIPQALIDALIDFGERRPAGGGVEACYFTKRSWRHLASYLGPAARHFERYRSTYVILSGDGTVVTTGWRH